jgi:hypothetical protein
LYDFLEFSLNEISRIPEAMNSDAGDIKLSRDWLDPNFPEWETQSLWKWLIFDREHADQLEEAIRENPVSPGENFVLDRYIQICVWEEWREVFETVKTYLVEEYHAQPEEDDTGCNKQEYEE